MKPCGIRGVEKNFFSHGFFLNTYAIMSVYTAELLLTGNYRSLTRKICFSLVYSNLAGQNVQ